MNSILYSIYPLRGMDLRWRPPTVGARRIRDMTYHQKDGWKDAGGFSTIMPDVAATAVDVIGDSTLSSGFLVHPFYLFSEIESLHWFSQHGGRRQWLIFEAERDSGGMTLWYFNGSTAGSLGGGFTELTDASGDSLVFTSGSTKIGRRAHLGPRTRTQSIAWNGLLYLVNGHDVPIVFDGFKAERAGFDRAPAAPTGTVTAHGRCGNNMAKGLGLGTSWKGLSGTYGGQSLEQLTRLDFGYRYRVSFVNERGQESPLSAPSGLISGRNPKPNKLDEFDDITQDTFNGGYRMGRKFIALSIPVGGETTVARRLYRTRQLLNSEGELASRSAAENFYFLEEIRDNYCTSWEDGIPDGFLGSLVDELDFGAWPARANLIASFKNTVFLANSSGSEVRYSAPLLPEVYPVDNRISLGQDGSGEITAMHPTKNALFVFKRSAVYLIKGSPSSGFEAMPLTKSTGCIGANAVAEIPGMGLAFLGDNGIYLLRGALENTGTVTNVEHLSTPIPDYIDRINMSAAVQAVAITYKKDREFWMSVPVDGSEKNNFVLVYHYDVGSWSYRENYPIGCAITTSDHRGYLIFGSNVAGTDDRIGLNVYHHGATNKGSSSYAIQPMYETSDLNFGSVFKAVAPKQFLLNCVGYGDNDVTVNYTVNRSISQARTTNKVADQQNPEERYSVYGTAKWGDTFWYEHRPIVLRFDVSAMDKPAVRELRVTVEASGRRIQVMGLDIGVVASAPTQRIPINEVLQGQRG